MPFAVPKASPVLHLNEERGAVREVRSDADTGSPAPVRGVSIVVSSGDDGRLVRVAGELERATMLEFIEACIGGSEESIIIDLGGLTFMDGGGYSSLVVIREFAKSRQRRVTVRHACGQPARLIGLIADLEAAQAVANSRAGVQRADADPDAPVDEEVERRYSDVLAEFALTMTGFRVQAILDHLVESIVEVLPVDAAGATLITSEHEQHYMTASDEAALRCEALQDELGMGPCGLAYTGGSTVSVPDLHDDDQFPDFARGALTEGISAVFSFPLCHEGRRLGALDLYRRDPGALGERQLAVAQTFANVAAAYLVNAEARADLVASTQHAKHLALHDPLTGLANRTLLLERLGAAMDRCRRTGSLVALMYIDLDTFKAVNDTFGHRVGDEVLAIVAQRLTALLRPGDTVARLGGDEFAVLCDDIADASHLEPIADRVNDAFQQPFGVTTGPVEVGASIGIAIGNWTSTTPERILESADSLMYEVKRRGGGHALRSPVGHLAR
jgi:diguanylate cyclase (GGDEF)-like protein